VCISIYTLYDAQTLVNKLCDGLVFSTQAAYSRYHVYEYRHITDYLDVFRNFLLSFNQMLRENLNNNVQPFDVVLYTMLKKLC